VSDTCRKEIQEVLFQEKKTLPSILLSYCLSYCCLFNTKKYYEVREESLMAAFYRTAGPATLQIGICLGSAAPLQLPSALQSHSSRLATPWSRNQPRVSNSWHSLALFNVLFAFSNHLFIHKLFPAGYEFLLSNGTSGELMASSAN